MWHALEYSLVVYPILFVETWRTFSYILTWICTDTCLKTFSLSKRDEPRGSFSLSKRDKHWVGGWVPFLYLNKCCIFADYFDWMNGLSCIYLTGCDWLVITGSLCLNVTNVGWAGGLLFSYIFWLDFPLVLVTNLGIPPGLFPVLFSLSKRVLTWFPCCLKTFSLSKRDKPRGSFSLSKRDKHWVGGWVPFLYLFGY
jgi:hypothetical protein